MHERKSKSNQIKPSCTTATNKKLIDDLNLNARRDKRHGQFNRKK